MAQGLSRSRPSIIDVESEERHEALCRNFFDVIERAERKRKK